MVRILVLAPASCDAAACQSEDELRHGSVDPRRRRWSRHGSRGGRPPGFDEDRYKKRNTAERVINGPEQQRALASPL
ncbi:hypothetical protein ACIOMM_19930 [Streptomyces sp. NPDC087908]|uniref:hypothetical protein n=1 Tax=unclassified Streptomyces TaxID=2593676 RepID=UPI00164F71E4